jgi:hypothetical protein
MEPRRSCSLITVSSFVRAVDSGGYLTISILCEMDIGFRSCKVLCNCYPNRIIVFEQMIATFSLVLAASFDCIWFHINHLISWPKCLYSWEPFKSACCRRPMVACSPLIEPPCYNASRVLKRRAKSALRQLDLQNQQTVLRRRGSRPSAQGLGMTYCDLRSQ